MHQLAHCLKSFRHKFDRDDDFEEFLFILAFMLFVLLFVLLFVRVLVAIYMGHWGLFE